MDPDKLDDAICGLRGWRSAGEQYANRGGRLMQLDYQVDVALDEIEYRRDPDASPDDLGFERPDEKRLTWAMDGMREHFDDGCLGEDLQVVHDYLEQSAA